MVGPSLRRGDVVADKYQIIDLLGKGGMSTVWLARDVRLDKLWAIKEIGPNTRGAQGETLRRVIIDEAHLMKRLDHPAIPRVVDMLDTGETTFVVMDYVEGRSLARAMRDKGEPFGQEDVIRWGIQLCDVLGYLHGLGPGILYRDVKPANIIVRDDGTVRLIDFGIALDRKRYAAGDGRVVGTPGYAAPEQLAVPPSVHEEDAHEPWIDERADVYALGATLYSLVCGHVPHLIEGEGGARSVSFDMKPVREWNPRLSEGLERILVHATRQDRQERYGCMEEMRYDLEHFEELSEGWRAMQRAKVVRVLKRALLACMCFMVGTGFLMGSRAVGRSSYESVMHEALAASRTSSDDGPSDAEQLVCRAMELDSSSIAPYKLLLKVYEDDYELSESEARRLQKVFGKRSPIINDPGYAQLCFDVGVCYLGYYGTSTSGGSVGYMGIESSKAAFPWFTKALDETQAHAGALSEADLRAAQTYATIAGFYDEVSRAEREGRSAEGLYRSFFDSLAASLGHEIESVDGNKSAEGVRTRLCQTCAETLASPAYLSGFARAGVEEAEARQLFEGVARCLDSLNAFAHDSEHGEVYGPVFEEIAREMLLVEQNIAHVYGNPVVRTQEMGDKL